MKLAVKENGTTHYVDKDIIVYCKAERSYCTIYRLEGDEITCSKPLAALIRDLQYPNFFRIHNSFLINLQYVDKQIRSKDKLFVIMRNKDKLPVARSCRALFRKVMDDFLAR